MPRQHFNLLPILLAAVVLSLNLLGSGQFLAKPVAAASSTVTISNFAFVPQNLTIRVGDTVTWINTDPVVYTLWFTRVNDSSTYLFSDPINPVASWAHTFPDVVKLKYYSFNMLSVTGFLNVLPLSPTSTAVTCALANATVGKGFTCTATVTDSPPAGVPVVIPTGTATFSLAASSNATGSFTGSPCLLVQSSLVTSSCTVIFTGTTKGFANVVVTYGGDSAHLASASAVFSVKLQVSVGGVIVPVSKLGLLAPYIGILGIALGTTFILVRLRGKRLKASKTEAKQS